MGDFTTDTATARLRGTDTGHGTRGTLVALHAGVADRRAWTGCAPAWVGGGWRVISYDRRGFGDSEWDVAAHDHVDDLVEVLDDRGVDRAVLVGNSMGGAVAIDTALAHPERVRALVLVGSAVTGDPPIEWVYTEAERALEAQVEAADEAGDVERVNALECHYWLDGPDQPEGRVAGEARDLFLSMNGRALAAPDVGEWQQPASAWPRLGEIGVPALVVAGSLDERMVLALAERLASDIAGARLVELDGSAHLPSLDAGERFAGVVADFLASLR